MNNTDKKQPMTDEELAKISGGLRLTNNTLHPHCPYCHKAIGPLGAESHIEMCVLNPNSPYNKGYTER